MKRRRLVKGSPEAKAYMAKLRRLAVAKKKRGHEAQLGYALKLEAKGARHPMVGHRSLEFNPRSRRNPVDYQAVLSAAQKVGYSMQDAVRVASEFKRTGHIPSMISAQLRYFGRNPRARRNFPMPNAGRSITTKYAGPTNVRGARIIATASSGERMMVPYQYHLSGEAVHRYAAEKLADKLGLPKNFISGDAKGGYVFIIPEKNARGRCNPSCNNPRHEHGRRNPLSEIGRRGYRLGVMHGKSGGTPLTPTMSYAEARGIADEVAAQNGIAFRTESDADDFTKGFAHGYIDTVQTVGRPSGKGRRARQNPLLQTVALAGLNPGRRSVRNARRNPVPMPNPVNPPFRNGQKVPVEKAWAWVEKTGNKELMRQFKEAWELQKKANKDPKHVIWRTIDIGDPKKIEMVTAMAHYGDSPDAYYVPPKGSKKGERTLYRHKWGEGGGGKKSVPLLAASGGKALIMPLDGKKVAGDWLRH